MCDPVRGDKLFNEDRHLEPLPLPKFLTTELVDFLLQNAFSTQSLVLPDNLLVPSSNAIIYLGNLNNPEKYPPGDPNVLGPIQQNYRLYASGRYRLLFPLCIGTICHYVTIDVVFDLDSEDIFEHVVVYDSFASPQPVAEGTTVAEFLGGVQTFLLRFCFVERKNTKQYKVLRDDPHYILKNARYELCPRQKNGYDCGLFSFVVVLHLVLGVKPVFSQAEISSFRLAIYADLHGDGGGRTTQTRTSRSLTSEERRLRRICPSRMISFFSGLKKIKLESRVVQEVIVVDEEKKGNKELATEGNDADEITARKTENTGMQAEEFPHCSNDNDSSAEKKENTGMEVVEGEFPSDSHGGIATAAANIQEEPDVSDQKLHEQSPPHFCAYDSPTKSDIGEVAVDDEKSIAADVSDQKLQEESPPHFCAFDSPTKADIGEVADDDSPTKSDREEVAVDDKDSDGIDIMFLQLFFFRQDRLGSDEDSHEEEEEGTDDLVESTDTAFFSPDEEEEIENSNSNININNGNINKKGNDDDDSNGDGDSDGDNEDSDTEDENYSSSTAAREADDDDDDLEDFEDDCRALQDDLEQVEEEQPPEVPIADNRGQPELDDHGMIFDDFEEIYRRIDAYQEISGNRLKIVQSSGGGRLYQCASHHECTFKAKFGRIRLTDHLTCKTKHSCFFHSPTRTEGTADGRAEKGRVDRNMRKAHRMVAAVKAGDVSTADLMKAAETKLKVSVTYGQANQVLNRRNLGSASQTRLGYQLIIPYLNAFKGLNAGSHVAYERDNEYHLLRVFLCPGIMLEAMQVVRPVMSLDAAHMKTTRGGGTLYVASVKSACDHVFPVAVSLMVDNENKAGWTWFLENLRAALPILDQTHDSIEVVYKKFVFISDRQKGLVESLKEVFPDNHSCYCAIHITRNVEAKYGKKESKYVMPLARTFSRSYADALLAEMGGAARNYILQIEEPQWRSTAWLDDEALPPRYGFVSSNISESTNWMFDKARDVCWKSSVHIMLSTMVRRITKYSKEYAGKSGIVQSVVDQLSESWQKCAGMEVHPMNDEAGSLFTVFERRVNDFEELLGFNMNVTTKACDCGLWQDQGYPCVHAVAYFRSFRKMPFFQLLDTVDCKLTYENERLLFKKNIRTVCMDTLVRDGKTLPPKFLKRKAGRPKKRRYRKRCRQMAERAGREVKCGHCGQLGHNVRTCPAVTNREKKKKAATKSKNKGVKGIPELSLL